MGLDAILVFFFFEMCTSLLQLWETYLPKSWIYLLTWSIDFSVTNSVSTAPHHKCPPQTLTTYLGGTQPPGSSSQPPLALAIHVSLPYCMNTLLTFAGVQSLHLATTVWVSLHLPGALTVYIRCLLCEQAPHSGLQPHAEHLMDPS